MKLRILRVWLAKTSAEHSKGIWWSDERKHSSEMLCIFFIETVGWGLLWFALKGMISITSLRMFAWFQGCMALDLPKFSSKRLLGCLRPLKSGFFYLICTEESMGHCKASQLTRWASCVVGQIEMIFGSLFKLTLLSHEDHNRLACPLFFPTHHWPATNPRRLWLDLLTKWSADHSCEEEKLAKCTLKCHHSY